MAVVLGRGIVHRGRWCGCCGVLGVYALNAAPLATQWGPSNGQWIAHCILRMHGEACSSHSLKLVASMLVYIPYTGRFPIAIYQIGVPLGHPPPTSTLPKSLPPDFDPDPIVDFKIIGELSNVEMFIGICYCFSTA